LANHESARKRARQNPALRDRNRAVKSRLRTILKEARSALEAAQDDAAERVKRAERELQRAASKGVIPARRASRLVSRLTRRKAAR
jgi:small subunit ribosomal protein S20